MEFDKSRVYTALNADELKVGSKVVLANNIAMLKQRVFANDVTTLREVYLEDTAYRFASMGTCYVFAYLVEPPEKKVLKWTDLKLLDVLKHKYDEDTAVVIRLNNVPAGTSLHVNIGGEWLTDIELEEWEKVDDE